MDNRNMADNRNRKHNQSWLIAIPFLIVGGVLFLDRIGFYFPDWFFQWEMIVIMVGLFIGIKDRFRNPGWLIIVAVGLFFLADDFIPNLRLGRFILPAIFLGIGLLILTKSRTGRFRTPNLPPIANDPLTDYGVRTAPGSESAFPEDKAGPVPDINSTENVLDIASIFGNVKKIIMSKNFKGGEIVTVFGGADINLMHADFHNKVTIEAVNLFGGTKLIIPSSWEVKSEVVSIFGGIEDKRHFSSITVVPEKTLVLQGFCMFGGIEIKSFNRGN